MQADPTTDAAVRFVLDRLAEVYVTRDVAELRAIFAADPEVVMFSPGAERVVGIAAIGAKAESDWSRSEAATLTYQRTTVAASGPVAWAAVDADFTVRAGGAETTAPVHTTFILEQRDGEWRIVHAHYSLAPAVIGG
jgi:ketosteroid isomerase-like protein